MVRRPPRSPLDRSSAASDVYKRQPISDCGIEVFDVALVSPSACGIADGSISIDATNSNGFPMQYTITYGTPQVVWQSSPVFSNLAAGNTFYVAVRLSLIHISEPPRPY